MKNGYTMVRRLKLTPFELRIAIDALNAKRLKQKASGIDNRATSNLISICSMPLKLNYIRLNISRLYATCEVEIRSAFFVAVKLYRQRGEEHVQNEILPKPYWRWLKCSLIFSIPTDIIPEFMQTHRGGTIRGITKRPSSAAGFTHTIKQ